MPDQQKISSQDRIELWLVLILLALVVVAGIFALAAVATGNGSLWWGTVFFGGIAVILRLHWTPAETD